MKSIARNSDGRAPADAMNGIIRSRSERRQLERDNAKLPLKLQRIQRDEWPDPNYTALEVWRSRHFLVQVFEAKAPAIRRLSVNRTTLDGTRWAEGISWNQLQQLKSECGFGGYDTVEVYPRDCDVVDDASMRHVWIMPDLLPFAWGADGRTRTVA